MASKKKGGADPNPGPATAPEPTPDLDKHPLPLIPIAADSELFRVHDAADGPVYWGPRVPPKFRFDDPKSIFGTLYVGTNLEIAFVETVIRNPRLKLIARSEVDIRRWSVLKPDRNLQLVDFAGPGLSAVGTDGGVNTGPYKVSRKWASALYHHPSKPDGIYYPSRHDPALRCMAIFSDRGINLAASGAQKFDPRWLYTVMKNYGKVLSI